MTLDDLAEISSLAIESKASWGYSPEEMEIFEEELTLTQSYLDNMADAQVAIRNNQVVGYYTVRLHELDAPELDHLFVSASRLHQGIGSKLLASSLQFAEHSGAETLMVVSDPNAEGFYKRHGAIKKGNHASSIAGRTIPILEFALDPAGS